MNDSTARRFVRVARYSALGLVVVFAIAYLVWRPFVPGGPAMTDFSAYYAAGATWLHHGDPYSFSLWNAERHLPGGGGARDGLNPYVGPPLDLPLWALLSLLPYGIAIIVWGAFLVLCIGIVLIVPARLAGRALDRGDALSLLLFACACAPLILGLALGQAAIPAVAALALALLMLARARIGWTAFFAAGAAVFKPNLALVLVPMLRSGRVAFACAIAALVTAALNVVAVGGLPRALAYLGLLPQHTASERFYSYQFTPTAIAHGFGLAPGPAERTGVVIAIVAVVLVCVVIWRRRAGLVDGALLCCAALPFAIPYLHEVDFAVVVLPAFVAFYRARADATVLAACALVALSVNPFGLARGPSAVAFSLVGATVAALALAALARGPRLALRFVPFAVPVLVLGLGMAAPKQILPTWPADLPRDFMAGRHAPPNVVWHREIVATGLEDVNPWVAFLRTITLAGCALAGVAMAISVESEPATQRGMIVVRRRTGAVAVPESSGS